MRSLQLSKKKLATHEGIVDFEVVQPRVVLKPPGAI
jgi:hypothetical protein